MAGMPAANYGKLYGEWEMDRGIHQAVRGHQRLKVLPLLRKGLPIRTLT